MRVKSFIRVSGDVSESFLSSPSTLSSSWISDSALVPIEVELTLAPGLPQIQFLGLPDTALRESVLRIRSAIREQGFELPQAQQVLVHLKPTHLRKSSRGLDLAVAAALLWETEQIPKPESEAMPVLYGELTLKGEVERPSDLEDLDADRLESFGIKGAIYTGRGGGALFFELREVASLRALSEPDLVPGVIEELTVQRPQPRIRTLPMQAVELAEIIAAGEHSSLLAGPPGSGKSTLAEAIPSWIAEPSRNCLLTQRRCARGLSAMPSRSAEQDPIRIGLWRPVIRPHHSITPLAMIGGGVPPSPGEITRAHEGVLILDELLEFNSEIQESLREPIESGEIRISRGRSVRTFPASALVIATTNLCPCGKFVPGQTTTRCRCTKAMLRRMIGRLTGPFVDRFEVVAFTDQWSRRNGTGDASVDKIAERVGRAIEFRGVSRGQRVPNARIELRSIEESITKFQRENLLQPQTGLSRRRHQAVLRVARTIADLAQSAEIRNQDLEAALRLASRSHLLLESSLG